ncbi:uncharacterized protein DFL_005738 [Arthrobotrys flagrans]|uniref:Uncharacterized protein n=1 Tax=Arthrobotrys flagrans TaxID=97331 RepID=A0A436ZYC5_ARTFL|nr:hypothetical protein DFL_005738 [Arthrobotrys flagrans]
MGPTGHMEIARKMRLSQRLGLRPLPAADGRYEKEIEPSSGFFKDLKIFRIRDIQVLREVIQQRVAGELIDDKTYITKRIIQLVADLPTGSRNRVAAANDVRYSGLDL